LTKPPPWPPNAKSAVSRLATAGGDAGRYKNGGDAGRYGNGGDAGRYKNDGRAAPIVSTGREPGDATSAGA
jgi:hypothetical protein